MIAGYWLPLFRARMLLDIAGCVFSGAGEPLMEPLRRDNFPTLRLTRFS